MSKRILLCVVAVLGTVWTARADIDLTQHIQNAGFESSTVFSNSCSPTICDPTQFWNYAAPFWTVVGTGGDYRAKQGTSSSPGSFDPATPSTGPAFINPFSGLNIGWLEPGAYMYQTTNLVLVPDEKYTVHYEVGRRLEQSPSNFQITATAGPTTGPFIEGVNTWRLYGNTSSITPGTWQSETLSFSTTDSALSGQPLTIWLGAEGSTNQPLAVSGSGQVNFDVPEPGEITLLLISISLVGLLTGVRKSSVS